MSITPEPVETQAGPLSNGQKPHLLRIREMIDIARISTSMIPPQPKVALIIAGGTEPLTPRLKNRLTDLLSRGVAQAAVDCNAILLDDGMKAGISEIVGQGVADRGRLTRLVGVLPLGEGTPPDVSTTEENRSWAANHTHFIINEQEAPDRQAEIICNLAASVSCYPKQNMTILAGGEINGPAINVALETVRRKWNLIVLEDSGPLADEIVKLKKQAMKWERRTGKSWKLFRPLLPYNHLKQLQETNPHLYEIISDGKIRIIGRNFDAIQLRNLIIGISRPTEENLLWAAWQRFAEYDQNSVRHRGLWNRLKSLPLLLGVLSTLAVLIYSATPPNMAALAETSQDLIWVNAYSTFMQSIINFLTKYPLVNLLLRFTIIVLPITISIIMGIETRLKLGSKYIVLRGAAEAVKRGIYSYRALGDKKIKKGEVHLPYNEKTLEEHLKNTSKLLLESDVNEAAFNPYTGSIPPNMFGAEEYDDGFSFLDPEKYIKIRVGDQLKFYTSRTNQYEKRIRRLQYGMLLLGGLGTLLAAIGAQYWLPFTAAIVSAATAYLEYQQLEHILTKYNLTKSSLENARAKWLSLPKEKRPAYFPTLVRDVEAILESENQGWVQYVTQVQEGTKPGDKGTTGQEEHSEEKQVASDN